MVLGGMALVLSRLIDNSVVVLENIFRHFEMGSGNIKAAQEGGKEVQLAVLAATFGTAIVFFPVVLLTGVSKYLFTAPGTGRSHRVVLLLRRGHDGRAALLFEVHQAYRAQRRTRIRGRGRSGA